MNQLKSSASPYLLQHAEQPVHWYEWNADALQAAKEQNKPILLSIGYSACHWCHVMARESFSDDETADILNRHFISIKVDREERPDLDRIYQLTHQALTQQGGGWPLTVFLAPQDQTPFFSGTYFPFEPRYGMPSFKQLLMRIAAVWQQRQDDILSQNQQMRAFLADMSQADATGAVPDIDMARKAARRLYEQFDQTHGGFGGAPKFPQAPQLRLLLDLTSLPDDASQYCHQMLRLTLEQMAKSGLNDHLEGGFYRYCVDAEWEIPHFEKMLYDNSQLLLLYSCYGRMQDDQRLSQSAADIIGWIKQRMLSGQGGFFSSLNADSEGEEGRYYIWQKDEVRALLSDDEFELLAATYGLNRPANFENHAWHLVEQSEVTDPQQQATIDSAKRKLLQIRSQRIEPSRDDKVLTAWNALTIEALSMASLYLNDPNAGRLAVNALANLRDTVFNDGRLNAVFAAGQPRFMGYLDDYAFTLAACLAVLQVEFTDETLDFAIDLASVILDRFQDPDQGSFFFTADDHEALIQRPRNVHDDAIPNGAAVAARSLLKLANLVDNPDYIRAAESALMSVANDLGRAPEAASSFVSALIEYHSPAKTVIIVSNNPSAIPDLPAVHPRDAIYRLPAESKTARRFPQTADWTAYICRGTHCEPPLTDANALVGCLVNKVTLSG